MRPFAGTTALLVCTLAMPLAAQMRIPTPLPAVKQPTVTRVVQVAAGSLAGRVLAHGTRTPVEAAALKLSTKDGKELGAWKTLADGKFATPKLAAGDYRLTFDGGVALDLAVRDDAKIASLDIVLPKPSSEQVNGAPPRTSPSAPAGGLSTEAWILIGAGAAVAVAVPVAIAASDDDDERVVSPSGVRTKR